MPIEIVVEIGNDKQKILIEQELRSIELALDEAKLSIPLHQIIVAKDFQAQINSLEGVDTYKSIRGFGSNTINVMGKIAKLNDGFAIVLSPSLYTESHDIETRLLFILHELHHIVNKREFPPPLPSIPFIPSYCTERLYFLYDEYTSDRFAFQVTDMLYPSKSKYRDMFLENNAQGFLELITDLKYYDHFRAEIQAFKNHLDLDLFLKSTQSQFIEVATVLVHMFSLIHFYPDKISQEDLLKSRFVNKKTFALMDYFRTKANQKKPI